MNNDEKKHNIEQNIMNQIETGKVKLRSKYIFLAQKLGLGSAIVLSFILSVLILALVFVSLRMTGNLEFLNFGKPGWMAFFGTFPYGLVIASIIFILVVGFFIRKSNWVYKIKFGYLASIFVCLVLILSLGISFARVSNFLTESMLRHGIGSRMMAPNRCGDDHSFQGIIEECEVNKIWIQTPCGTKIGIFNNESEELIYNCENKIILAVGKDHGDFFEIKEFKLLEIEKVPKVRQKFYREMPYPGRTN